MECEEIKKGLETPRPLSLLAGTTRLELATSGVTGRRSNQTELRPRFFVFRLLLGDLPGQKPGRSNQTEPFDFAPIDKLRVCYRACSYVPDGVILVGGTGFEPATPGL
jgi:hypothetical protein